jgi:hypothetical protein
MAVSVILAQTQTIIFCRYSRDSLNEKTIDIYSRKGLMNLYWAGAGILNLAVNA